MELGGEASRTMSWARLPGKWCHRHDNGWETMILGEATLGAGGAIPLELGGGTMPFAWARLAKEVISLARQLGGLCCGKKPALEIHRQLRWERGGNRPPPRLNTSRRRHALLP